MYCHRKYMLLKNIFQYLKKNIFIECEASPLNTKYLKWGLLSRYKLLYHRIRQYDTDLLSLVAQALRYFGKSN